jgi:hypothetical protein
VKIVGKRKYKESYSHIQVGPICLNVSRGYCWSLKLKIIAPESRGSPYSEKYELDLEDIARVALT